MAERTCRDCGDPLTKKPGPGRWPVRCPECRPPRTPARHQTAPLEAICATCGAWFMRHRADNRARFCSSACLYARPRGESRCDYCGATFIQRRHRAQECCSTECAGRLKQSGKSSPIPWASCLHCQQWFSTRHGRRVHGCVKPNRTRSFINQCVTCGATFDGRTSKQRYCHNPCRPKKQKHQSPEAKRAARSRRRARERAARVERFSHLEVFERDGWRCHLCGKQTKRTAEVPDPQAPTIDHLVPLAEGGEHSRANTRCACFMCNSLKGDRPQGEQLMLIG